MKFRSPSVLLLLSLTAKCAFAGVVGGLNLHEVASGVYVHQGVHELPNRSNHGEIANIGFIVGDRCVAVIDTGGSHEQGKGLKEAIAATTRVPVCYVVNTHAHPDHIFGNLVFKQAGVVFIGHHKLAQAISLRGPYYLEKAERDAGRDVKTEDLVLPDEGVENRRVLDLGGRKLTLTAHRTAHTDNDLSVYDDKTETLWLSDLLFVDHIPVVDGSLNGWLRELDALKTIKAKLAIPGHGPVAMEWPKAMEPEVRYLQQLRDDIRGYIKQRKTMERAMEEVGLSTRKDWQLFDEFHKRNIATAFAELEWEDD